MAPPIDTTGIEHFKISGFTFSDGTVMDIELVYRQFNKQAGKAVLIPTCFGGRINTTLNFTSGALKDHHVIVVAMLGNGQSTSPSTLPSVVGERASFPKLRYMDQVNAQYRLLTEHLGIKELEAVVGFSMGGQQAYHWAVMHGSVSTATTTTPFLKNMVGICTSAKTSSHNIAFLEGPVAALMASSDYDEGRYRAKGEKPIKGLRAFGSAYAGWLTSPEWFDQELWRKQGARCLEERLRPWEFAVDDESGRKGEGPYESWDAEDLLVLARCWQAGDVGKAEAAEGSHRDWREALRGIQCRVLLMPSRTDQYFRWEHSREEMRYLERAELAPIETVWGHVAGGGANEADAKWMDAKIAEFLKQA